MDSADRDLAVDALCDAFESWWRNGSSPRIEDSLVRCPDSLRAEALEELIRVEVELRTSAGEKVSQTEYDRRFPQDRNSIEGAFRSSDHEDEFASEGPTLDEGVVVRCPHCFETITLVADEEHTDIVCLRCGERIDLVRDQQHDHSDPVVHQVLGHFELIEKVGAGSFGTVWKSRDLTLDRYVAVKVPRAGRIDHAEEKALVREAQNAAQLSHPGIVPVHEVGRDGDTVYIVSELIYGLTLADWMEDQRPSPLEAAELVQLVAEALHHAHERGVVHRDLTPRNVILDERLLPRLTDFGLAKRERADITMTLDGQLLGTPAYMSPEQARGDSNTADGRSDVYSLGVVLFQLITGELPFRGSARLVLHQVLNDEPPTPRSLSPHIHRDLDTITLKCLEKSRDRRYQTAAELAEDLQRWRDRKPIKARHIGAFERSLRAILRRPLVAGLGALATISLLLLAILGPWLAWRENRLRRDTQQSQAEAAEARLESDERLMDSLISLGQASLALRHPGVREHFVEAAHIAERLGLTRHAITAGFMQSLREQPPPLLGKDGALAWVGGFENPPTRVLSAHFVSGGKHVLTFCRDGYLVWWDAFTGLEMSRQHVEGPPLRQLQLAGETGVVVAVRGQHEIVVIDGEKVRLVHRFDTPVRLIAVDPSGDRIAVTCRGSDTFVLAISSDADPTVLESQLGPKSQLVVTVLQFHPSGDRVAVCYESRAICLFDVNSGDLLDTVETGTGSDAVQPHELSFLPDSDSFVTIDIDGNLIEWSLETKSRVNAIHAFSSRGYCVHAGSGRDRVIATGRSGEVLLCDLVKNEVVTALAVHPSEVVSLDVTKDASRVLTVDASGQVRLDRVVYSPNSDLMGHNDRVLSISAGCDDSLLLTCSFDGHLHIYDADSCVRLRRLSVGPSRVWDAALVEQDTRAVTIHEDGTLAAWDIFSGVVLQQTKAHDGGGLCLDVSDDGKYVATGGKDGLARVWRLDSLEKVADLHGHVSLVRDIEFLPRTRLVATASYDHTVRVWDLETKQESAPAVRHRHWASLVASDSVGDRFVSGGWDLGVRVHSISGASPAKEMTRCDANITALAFAQRDEVLYIGSHDGTLRLSDPHEYNKAGQVALGAPITAIAVVNEPGVVITGYEHGGMQVSPIAPLEDYERHGRAVRNARTRLQANPLDNAALSVMAGFYFKRGDYKSALQLLQRHEEIDNDQVLHRMAICHLSQSDHEAARDALGKCSQAIRSTARWILFQALASAH